MVQSNKVLTVSYGTFSCTLEGFEDSFDTMKAIAEYFRDLAADDRYFGAEPPQPDAEMLARIAQREIARQVEARREGSGFVLRAAEMAPVPMAAPPAAAPAVAPVAPATPATEEIVAEAAEEIAETAAATLAEAEAPMLAAEEVATDAVLPETQEDILAGASPSEDAVAAFMATAEPVEDIEEDEAPELVAEPVAEAPAPSPDSIAAKLQRIRAVVSRNEKAGSAPATPEAYDEEPQSGADFIAQAARDIAAALDEDHGDHAEELLEIEDHAEEAPLVLTGEITEPEEEDHQDEVALFDDLDSAPQPEEDTAATPENILVQADERPHARVIKIKRAELEAALAAGDLEEVDDDDDADIELEVEDEDDEASAEDHIAVALKHPRAPAQPLPPGTLSPEDEADLLRELAEVEAELRGDHAELDDEEPEVETPAAAQHEAEEELPVAAPVAAFEPARQAQSDLSRLMAAADARLEDPETASTRETYSHLRAAVAATEAENSATGLAPKHPDAEAYRDDLARAVQPRRPVVTGSSRRPRRDDDGAPRPAPLKLVAEQRVDDMAPATVRPGPIHPRRVAAAHETPRPVETPSEGFAQFAHEMGATELPALLEAAAAYMQFVEGREQFTRPQLIHKAREASVEEFNREDGLRSFGVLLREGKIVKKDPGRFVASGEIGFQPTSSTRAAG